MCFVLSEGKLRKHWPLLVVSFVAFSGLLWATTLPSSCDDECNLRFVLLPLFVRNIFAITIGLVFIAALLVFYVHEVQTNDYVYSGMPRPPVLSERNLGRPVQFFGPMASLQKFGGRSAPSKRELLINRAGRRRNSGYRTRCR